MKKLVQSALRLSARAIIRKYDPTVVGVTGSVGKTSAKEAIFAVLASKHKVRQNIKNYNNEIGLPLTVIGVSSPGRNPFGWLAVFVRVLGLLVFEDKNYPEVLVLEMGIDHPGDMDYLMSIVRPDIGVLTAIGHSHLEHFGSLKNIQKEKGVLIESVPTDGWCVINGDSLEARDLARRTQARTVFFGLDSKDDMRASDINLVKRRDGDTDVYGLNFKMAHQGSFVPVFLPGTLGEASVYAALSAASVGIAMGMNLVEISQALASFRPPRGRMNLLSGVKDTLLVDDSYNASPQSVTSGLRSIARSGLGLRRLAILGDMLELGSYTEAGHREVGSLAVASGFEKLILVGERARIIGAAAEEAGLSRDSIFHFDDPSEAGRFVKEELESGDLVYVKASQGMRLEKASYELLADPRRAEEFLVRFGAEWRHK